MQPHGPTARSSVTRYPGAVLRADGFWVDQARGTMLKWTWAMLCLPSIVEVRLHLSLGTDPVARVISTCA